MADRDLQDIGREAFECIEDMVRPIVSPFVTYEDPDGEASVNVPADDDDEHERLEEAGWALAVDSEENEERARERISEDPLSIELTGTWLLGEEPSASGFIILLSTGGPAVRIVGELDGCGEPSSARLEAQDWFKPWTEVPCDQHTLLAYCRCFYFGDGA